jgi:hypothetical protein
LLIPSAHVPGGFGCDLAPSIEFCKLHLLLREWTL